MKYTLLVFIQLFSIFYEVTAQNNTICLVKYKDFKSDLGTYNYWFHKEKLISINESNFKKIYSGGFPVLANGIMTTQTDTLKYNKEFNEFIKDIKEISKNRKDRVIKKEYNSNILKTAIFAYGLNKDYVVFDTLEKMGDWEILNDTATIMGFKCQQAVINYRQDKWYAWFTIQLPYSAGPDGFRGLPGLILKVSNVSAKIGFEAVEILTPYKGLIPKFEEVGEPISLKEWLMIAAESNKKSKEAKENRRKQLKKEEEAQNQ